MAFPSIDKKKWLRRAAWAAGAVAVLWGVGWLAVPPVAKSLLEKKGSEALGRTLSVGRVDFKPWTLELTLEDVAIAKADGSAPQLIIKRIYLDAELQSLVRLAPVVDAVTVDEPHLWLAHRGDGHYDVDDLLARFSQPSDKPAGDPPGFALYNLALHGGAVDFADATVGKTHEVRALQFTLPFLSNLASQRDIRVEPRLAFTLNGSRFDSAAEGTPFAQTRRGEAQLQLAGFDLAPYLGYLPASLPVRLQSAVLDARLQLAFEQTPTPQVRLSGELAARQVRVADAASQELLAFDALTVALADVRPLAQRVALSAVTLERPRLLAHRSADGRINLALGAAPAASGKTPAPTPAVAAASTPALASSSAKSPTPSSPAPAWQVEVAKLAVRDGAVAWRDDGTAPSARLDLSQLAIEASDLHWPATKPAPFSGSAVLGLPAAAESPKAVPATPQKGGKGGKAPSTPAPAPAMAPAKLAFSGSATDRAASVKGNLGAFSLRYAAPYAAQYLVPVLDGVLEADWALDWQAPATPGQDMGLVLQLPRLVLTQLALGEGKAAPAALANLQLADARLDLAQHSLAIGKLALQQPRARVERTPDGRWMYESWLRQAMQEAKASPGTPPQAAPAAGTSGGKADLKADAQTAQAWKLTLGELQVDGGAVSYLDRAAPRPVAAEFTALTLQASRLALGDSRASPLTVSARIAAGPGEPGRLDYRGTIALAPVAAQGQLQVVRLPVQAFEPYFGDSLNLELVRADASFKGAVRYAQAAGGMNLKVSGDAAVEDLRANSLAATPGPDSKGEDLLNWKALSLRGLDLALEPGKPLNLEVKETALSDFFARLIIFENGRINLQDVVKQAGAAPAQLAPAAQPASATQPAQQPVPAAAVATAEPTGPAPVVRFGPVSLINGRVNFSDRFVKPNYSAALSELTGRLSAFSSLAGPAGAPPEMADLELRGRAEGTASLEITGKLNPLAKPLALDIRGKVRDLELPPLSPYSVKYAGHGIERGKLSVDVAYRVQPDGQLTAANKLVLNQLTFGEPVPGAPNSLPVKLAVALLADRHGVIDLDLPISGSLNDPQFSLGPVIFKIIGNLIVKAVTSPFALLASAFGGGGDELSQVAFAPGSSALRGEARQGLDKVAQALAERPGLKLTITGEASLEAEREAYRRAQLRQQLRAEKRRASVLAGNAQAATASAQQDAGAEAGGGPAEVAEGEYAALLKEVYKRADIPKPRNLIGLAKDLPMAEMEALLLASIPVDEDIVRALAVRRGVVVRDYLATRNIPTDRLFLGAAKTPDAKSGAAWQPRADLSLAMP